MSLILLIFLILKTISFRNITLTGNITLNYYYLDLYVGTPPQKRSLIIDTGSHSTIFPCECPSCNHHINGNFEKDKSSTFEYMIPNKRYFDWQCNSLNIQKCNFVQQYSEESLYKGFYAIDTVRFKNELDDKKTQNYKAIFGCANLEDGMFKDQLVDGIIGIGPSKALSNLIS